MDQYQQDSQQIMTESLELQDLENLEIKKRDLQRLIENTEKREEEIKSVLDQLEDEHKQIDENLKKQAQGVFEDKGGEKGGQYADLCAGVSAINYFPTYIKQILELADKMKPWTARLRAVQGELSELRDQLYRLED